MNQGRFFCLVERWCLNIPQSHCFCLALADSEWFRQCYAWTSSYVKANAYWLLGTLYIWAGWQDVSSLKLALMGLRIHGNLWMLVYQSSCWISSCLAEIKLFLNPLERNQKWPLGACSDQELCMSIVKGKKKHGFELHEDSGIFSIMGRNETVITDRQVSYIGLSILALWISFLGGGWFHFRSHITALQHASIWGSAQRLRIRPPEGYFSHWEWIPNWIWMENLTSLLLGLSTYKDEWPELCLFVWNTDPVI